MTVTFLAKWMVTQLRQSSVAIGAALCLAGVAFAQSTDTFSLPKATLLFGTYNELRVVTPDGLQIIKPPVEVAANYGYFVNPVLSQKGNVIAWAFASHLDNERDKNRARFILGVYSLQLRAWKTYGDFDDIGSLCFSSDEANIVFLAKTRQASGFFALDVASGNIAKSSYVPEPYIGVAFPRSSAADGSHLLLEVKRSGKSSIAVLDTRNSMLRSIVEGSSPVWSPDSNWIAYFDSSGSKCFVIRSDGTGRRVVKKLKQAVFSYKRFGIAPPVWSPDSKHLILTEMKGDGDFLDDVIIDLDTDKEGRKEHNMLAVFGWSQTGS
jgi:hypothetical protein